MALNWGDILLAATEGGAKGAAEVQKARQERLDKRIKELQKNDVELAKSRHKTAYNEYTKRKESFAPIMSAGDNETRNYIYNKEILKLPEKEALNRAKTESLDISDEWIQSQIGDEPLENYGATDYSSVQPQSVLGSLGIGEEGPTVEDQVAAIRAQATSKQYQSPTAAAPAKLEAAPVQREWMNVKDDTAKMQDIQFVADRMQEKNPKLSRKDAMIAATEAVYAKISPTSGQMVSPVAEFGGTGGEAAAAQAEAQFQKMPYVIPKFKEGLAIVKEYMKTEPYGGTIENENDYVFALTEKSRNLAAQLKIPFTEARSMAELMLIPNQDAVKTGDTWMPDILETNYKFNPEDTINISTQELRYYLNEYNYKAKPEDKKSYTEIVRAIIKNKKKGK